MATIEMPTPTVPIQIKEDLNIAQLGPQEAAFLPKLGPEQRNRGFFDKLIARLDVHDAFDQDILDPLGEKVGRSHTEISRYGGDYTAFTTEYDLDNHPLIARETIFGQDRTISYYEVRDVANDRLVSRITRKQDAEANIGIDVYKSESDFVFDGDAYLAKTQQVFSSAGVLIRESRRNFINNASGITVASEDTTNFSSIDGKAVSTKHMTYEYDEEGRIIRDVKEEHFTMRRYSKRSTRTHVYMGNSTTVTNTTEHFHSNSNLEGEPDVVSTETAISENNKLRKRIHDVQDFIPDPGAQVPGITKSIGRLTFTEEYDSSGRMIKTATRNVFTDTVVSDEAREFYYDPKGKITTAIWYDYYHDVVYTLEPTLDKSSFPTYPQRDNVRAGDVMPPYALEPLREKRNWKVTSRKPIGLKAAA